MWFYNSLKRIVLCRLCHKQSRCETTQSYDPFKILGIPPDANKETIKSAYLRLAKLYHPDRNPSSEDARIKFERVQNAYRFVMERVAERSNGKL